MRKFNEIDEACEVAETHLAKADNVLNVEFSEYVVEYDVFREDCLDKRRLWRRDLRRMLLRGPFKF